MEGDITSNYRVHMILNTYFSPKCCSTPSFQISVFQHNHILVNVSDVKQLEKSERKNEKNDLTQFGKENRRPEMNAMEVKMCGFFGDFCFVLFCCYLLFFSNMWKIYFKDHFNLLFC